MPLTIAGTGVTKQIKRIGGKEEVRRFLEHLGFVAGSEIMVVSENGGHVAGVLYFCDDGGNLGDRLGE